MTKNYESLQRVLDRAFVQASEGKGAERHAQDLPFEEQPMQKLCELYGVGFALGQAAKKAQESQRMPVDRAVAELLGAINYLAGAVVFLEAGKLTGKPESIRAPNQPWIAWVGGLSTPHKAGHDWVRIKRRDGLVVSRRVCNLRWTHRGVDADIVAYYFLPIEHAQREVDL